MTATPPSTADGGTVPLPGTARWTLEEWRGLRVFAAVLAATLALSALYALGARRLIDLAYEQRGPAWLNRLISNTDGGPVEPYYDKALFLASHGLSWLVLAGLAALAWGFRRRIARRLRLFFTEENYALNLAAFRIVFSYVLWSQLDWREIIRQSSLPDSLRVPPVGWGWALAFLPFSETAARVAIQVLTVCCWTGMVGLFSRTSAAVACLAGLYALGIPQCFGKVDHYNFQIWFLAILAVSRCGDACSLDALWRRWWRPESRIDLARPASAYGVALNFIWLLIGVCYFFPGFWKLFGVGAVGQWAWSDNMRYQLYDQWDVFGGWRPPWRIDQYPWVFQALAWATIVFELGFIAAVFFPHARLPALLSAVAFHKGTKYFINIEFTSLMVTFVGLLDWHAMLGFVRRLVARPATATGSAAASPALDESARSLSPPRASPALYAVGFFLVGMNSLFGALHIVEGWPFACNPTFAYEQKPYRPILEIETQAADGPWRTVPLEPIQKAVSLDNWHQWCRVINRQPSPDRDARLKSLWQELARRKLVPQEAAAIRMYKTKVSTIPEEDHRVITKELLLEFEP